MQNQAAQPESLHGKIKSFGPFGPKYQIGEPARQLDNGDWLLKVTLIETGETAEYSLAHAKEDPEAA